MDEGSPFGTWRGKRIMWADGVAYVQCLCGVAHPLVEVGMLARLPYRMYLSSDHWRRLREYVLESKGWRCERCGTPKDLQVHHQTYERRGYEDLDDLDVLCRACHAGHHNQPVEPIVLFGEKYPL